MNDILFSDLRLKWIPPQIFEIHSFLFIVDISSVNSNQVHKNAIPDALVAGMVFDIWYVHVMTFHSLIPKPTQSGAWFNENEWKMISKKWKSCSNNIWMHRI